MRVGLITPTRGDRPQFIEQCKKLMKLQTLQPNEWEIVDEKPLNNEVDITYRFRIGFERLKDKVDVIVIIEDDDWYSSSYIEKMVNGWIDNGKPDIFGLNNTVYYNINTNKYTHFYHKGRASMMATVLSAKAKINWGKDNYAYTDMVLWQQLKGVSVDLGIINMGIKHGVGLCGGAGHNPDWGKYQLVDSDLSYLKSITKKDWLFYAGIEIRGNKKPFLSIVTRKYKRPIGLSKNMQSVDSLKSNKWEQIIINDNVGKGVLEANKSFEKVKDLIKGKYVFLLDDDDFIVNENMITDLEQIAQLHKPDVICFKMLIKNHNNCDYPLSDVWEKEPKAGSIGGSCFVVSKEVYNKFIHHFGVYPMGDFNFINEVFKYDINVYWHDKRMAETGKVSRGATE